MYGAACEKMLMAQNESLGIVFKMKGNLRIIKNEGFIRKISMD